MYLKKLVVVFSFCSLPFLGRGQIVPLLTNATDYQLVFQDEFDGNALDWNVWESDDAISTSPSNQIVGRWKENAVVENGLLKLFVKKANRTDSEWTAGYVWVKQVFGVNTYYESRFRLTNATGVNNSFWTAVRTMANSSTNTYKNRYEIDVVEAKRLNGENSITGKWSWHDWKSYINGNYISMGVSKTYNTIDFQTWGLWVGEDNFIVYCDGVEQWRGTTHPTYTNQWYTGIGKISTWSTIEEKRAYGKWGQSDWNYTGGMNGDDMNICLSTMPWTSTNSTLFSAANNTSMDVDFMRIYKRKSDLNINPVQTVTVPKSEQLISLTKPIDLNTNKNYYISFVANRPYNSAISCALKANTQTEITFKVSEDNELVLFDASNEVSTAVGYPASSYAVSYFETGINYLIVGRITASTTVKDIISMSSFEVGKPILAREPFLYRNIDSNGNTSITNEWKINKKINSTKVLTQLVLSDAEQKCQFSDLTFGDNYKAVISKYLNKPLAYIYGETKSSTERRIYMSFEGKLPFSVTYTDGKQQTTINNISLSPYTFTVNPVGISQYSIVSATDADGTDAEVGGSADFYITDADFLTIKPSFDTYLTEGTTTNPHTAADLFVTSKQGTAQESFLVFQLPENQNATERANTVIYCTSKSVTTSTKIELLGSTQTVDNTTTWSTAPAANSWEIIGSKVLGATSGFYIDFDITPFCNARLANNQRTFTLKIRQTIGDASAITKFKPGNNTTSSVPSFMVLKKDIQNNVFATKLSIKPILHFQPSTRQLENCSDMAISNVLLYNVAGQLLVQSSTLPLLIPNQYNGILMAHIVTSKQTFVQKIKL